MNVLPQCAPELRVGGTQSFESGGYPEDFEDTLFATWTRSVTEECLDTVSFAEAARRLLDLPLMAMDS